MRKGKRTKKKIALIFDKRNKKAKAKVEIVYFWLRNRGIDVVEQPSNERIKKTTDLVVTFGGDGTVLHVANKVVRYNIPILRVNFGTRGCLCNVGEDEVFDALEKVLDGRYRLKKITRIQAKLDKKRQIDSLNEIFIGGINFRNSWLKVKIKARGIKRDLWATGDGLLFSTQNGSTAWNDKAGGPQLLTDVFCLTGSNAILSANGDWLSSKINSLVVSVNAKFEVQTLRWGPYKPYVVADGQRYYRFERDDVAVIQKSPHKTLFVELR